MTDIVKCIDVSHHQGEIDWRQVAGAGVIAMIHKATEGTSFTDDMCSPNFVAATAAGIACCTYHWLSPGSDPIDQMEFYLETVDPVPGERVVIDYEQDGCTLDMLHEAIERLLDDPRQLQITCYSGHLLKEQLNGERDPILAEHCDLWLAQYTEGTPSWPTGTFPHWTLWQYSESGTLPGINDAKVDLNRFDGTDAELVRWISPRGRQPQPEPDRGVVAIAIECSENVTLTISVNGELIATTATA
jgi:lysozyme